MRRAETTREEKFNLDCVLRVPQPFHQHLEALCHLNLAELAVDWRRVRKGVARRGRRDDVVFSGLPEDLDEVEEFEERSRPAVDKQNRPGFGLRNRRGDVNEVQIDSEGGGRQGDGGDKLWESVDSVSQERK